MKNYKLICTMVMFLALLTGCSSTANVASHNLAKDAEEFKILRRVVFVNGITDTYLYSIEGFCSIDAQMSQNQLEVTCKDMDGKFRKHHLGLSDNISYFSEQLKSSNVSGSHYKVIFKPASIIPDIDMVQ